MDTALRSFRIHAPATVWMGRTVLPPGITHATRGLAQGTEDKRTPGLAKKLKHNSRDVPSIRTSTIASAIRFGVPDHGSARTDSGFAGLTSARRPQ
jgi:hypothetical protein